jgi:hypothetical protein
VVKQANIETLCFKIFFRFLYFVILGLIVISKSFKTPDIDSSIVEKLRISIDIQEPLECDDFGCLYRLLNIKRGKLQRVLSLTPFLQK